MNNIESTADNMNAMCLKDDVDKYVDISPNNIFIDITKDMKKKEEETKIKWIDSYYLEFITLTSNNRGTVGEKFINELCKSIGINANVCGSKTKGKSNDGKINGKTVEIKTAYLGNGKKINTFQHELGQTPWKAEYMIFIDVTPTQIYITIFKNFEETQYKSKDKLTPYFPTKTISCRNGVGPYKLDTTEIINNENVKIGQCILINQTTNYEDLQKFFNKLFK